jgi:hypothetical protein
LATPYLDQYSAFDGQGNTFGAGRRNARLAKRKRRPPRSAQLIMSNFGATLPSSGAPPGFVATTDALKQPFVSSTSSQARRYDILSERPASEIEPVRSIASSSRILPGPSARFHPKSTRTVSLMVAICYRMKQYRQITTAMRFAEGLLKRAPL